jgi:hypothetical protein
MSARTGARLCSHSLQSKPGPPWQPRPKSTDENDVVWAVLRPKKASWSDFQFHRGLAVVDSAPFFNVENGIYRKIPKRTVLQHSSTVVRSTPVQGLVSLLRIGYCSTEILQYVLSTSQYCRKSFTYTILYPVVYWDFYLELVMIVRVSVPVRHFAPNTVHQW